jgi:hypothetical protein
MRPSFAPQPRVVLDIVVVAFACFFCEGGSDLLDHPEREVTGGGVSVDVGLDELGLSLG